MEQKETTGAKTWGNTADAEPVRFQKRIGSTVFEVAVYFSQTSKETLDDKILRLIKNEAFAERGRDDGKEIISKSAA